MLVTIRGSRVKNEVNLPPLQLLGVRLSPK